MSEDNSKISHDAVTLALAKKESAEHSHGMAELYKAMRKRPLRIQASPLSAASPSTTSDSPPNNNGKSIGITTTVKTVHFARHGQGFHNLMADIAKAEGRTWTQFTQSADNPYVMPEILDAPLTQKGRNQARALQPIVKNFSDKIELLVSSPMCRALQTALIAFEHTLNEQDEKEKAVPFTAHEMVREETGVHTCDKRRPKSQQMMEFPMVDFSLIESEEDELFMDHRRETKMEFGERVYQFMIWLSKRSESHIGVASHSGWLVTLFNGILECSDDSLKEWFQTGEMRSVKLIFTYDSNHC